MTIFEVKTDLYTDYGQRYNRILRFLNRIERCY